MINKDKSINKIILILATFLFCLSIFFLNSNKYNKESYVPPAINGDSHQYLSISLQIYKNNTITHDTPKIIGTPSNYREFLYPLYISLFYNLLDSELDYSDCVFEKNIKKCESFYKVIAMAQILLFFLTLMTALFFLYKSPAIYLITSIVITYLFYHKEMIFNFAPEHLSALLLMLSSFFLQKVIYSSKVKDLLVCGVLFACLIYIKNLFHFLAYIGIFITGIHLAIIFLKKKVYENSLIIRDHSSQKFFAISLIAIILIAPYQLRNTIHFDDSSLSKRGKEMLTLRNEFAKASYTELTEGFWYYSPNIFGYKNKKIEKFQTNSFFWEQNPKSHYRSYSKENGLTLNYFNKKYGTNYTGFGDLELYASDKLMKINIEIYLKNIVKQSYISCLMFFRGIASENNLAINDYGFSKKGALQRMIFDVISLFLFFYLFFCFFKSIKNRDFSKFIFYLPTIYFIFMMSTLSNYEPRMNSSIVIIIVLNFFINYRDKNLFMKRNI